jgi:hypothetical protein
MKGAATELTSGPYLGSSVADGQLEIGMDVRRMHVREVQVKSLHDCIVQFLSSARHEDHDWRNYLTIHFYGYGEHLLESWRCTRESAVHEPVVHRGVESGRKWSVRKDDRAFVLA